MRQHFPHPDFVVVAETREAEDEMRAHVGVDVFYIELAIALSIHRPRPEVAHHHALCTHGRKT